MFTGSGALRSALRSMNSIPPASGRRQNSKAAVDFVRHARETFEEAYNAPSFTSATARRVAESNLVSVDYTILQNDFARDSKRNFANHMTLSISSGQATVLTKGMPVDMAGAKVSLRSPSDPSLVAILCSANNSEAGRFVEIWRDGVLAKSIDVSGKHGDYYTDIFFNSLAWSTDNKHIMYSAERPEYEKAKPETTGCDTLEDIGNITDEIEGAVAGVADSRRYQFEGDWGESYIGKRPPVLVVVDVSNGAVEILPTIDNVSPGQAQFLARNGTEADQIVFTGYQHTVRKHGVLFCYNHPSGIYVCDMDGNGLKSIYTGSVRSARITPSGKGLVFLATATGGPHDSASELIYYDLATDRAHTLVPIIKQPLEEEKLVCGSRLPKGFVGIYTGQLPAQPWLQLGDPTHDILIFTSVWRSTVTVLTFDIQRLVLQVHSSNNCTLSNAVLSADGDLVIGTTSTPVHPEMLTIGEVTRDSHTQDLAIKWHHAASSTECDIDWRVIVNNGEHERAPECIFVYPQKPNNKTRYFWESGGAAARPLIVYPHGGPHSTFTTTYNAQVAGLARLGFGVLLVNFTGSLGFGLDAVLAQVGQMDTLTIKEIQNAAVDIHNNGDADSEATVYLGGSFGGYTGALLAGLVPGFYRGIAIRNPVIDIAANALTSDIPDWNWAEIGLEYSFDSPPELGPETFAKMWRASPARLIEKIRDPILLLLGASDSRVPNQQSLSFYYRLRAANAPVQCKVYPNVGHPLNTIEAERDGFVSLVRFFAASLEERRTE
ncbi:hypothetical protein H4S08_002080 [Coemansia sp. RSA 1365]|nr:hypothetical protein H4S08_002080 [Coemansia sp. RSA 1365]